MALSSWEVNMSVARLCVAAVAIVVFNCSSADRIVTVITKGKTPPEGWTALSPREEIKPRFAFEPASGHNGTGSLIIEADQFEGQTGWWAKSFPVVEGKYYRFQVFRKANNVATARRSARAVLKWQDAQGKSVPADQPWVTYDRRQKTPSAWPEF